jgi:hypothetical protein
MKRLLAIALLTACGTTDSGTDQPYGPGMGTPDNPVPQQGAVGPYMVVTHVDFSVEQVLPGQAEAIVATLRDFSKNPAHSIITLAQKEGVPAASALYDALPSQLTDKFEGWVNGYVDGVSIGGKKLTTWAGDMAGLADFALTKFDIDSTLAIDGMTSTHTVTMIDFTPTGFVNVKIPVDGVAAEILTQHPTIAVGEAGALTVGDESFGLLLGNYAWTALNNECTALFGGDLRTTIGKAVNCPALAKSIADKCVLTLCVGHESLIKDVCEGGLDALVDGLHDEFKLYNYGAHYMAGAATLVDADGDGVADHIVNGTWDAELNLGLGPRHAPATWDGERQDGPVVQ